MIFESKKVGIVSYGAKLPQFKVMGEEIAKAQGKSDQKLHKALGVMSKSVPGIDEDTISLSVASGFQAIQRLKMIDELFLNTIDSIFIGSESHPYAVKPSGTVVAQALGIASDSGNKKYGKPLATADLQFACKAGTQALQISNLYVTSGFTKYALAIGTDTAQSRPGDVLEYTAGAGSAAFIIGNSQDHILAKLLATTSVATDTPDFWRRPKQSYPEHAGRFTGEPGYFGHITLATKQILEETGMKPKDFDRCVFHTPNAKFPKSIAKRLGFTAKQLEASLVVEEIGNTYAGASMLGLVNTLDKAKSGEKILVVSYGSGAGSDAFVFETTPQLEKVKKQWSKEKSTKVSLEDQINTLIPVEYELYRKNSSH
jgi:hydroxymethylglutaryl-CoA synthase